MRGFAKNQKYYNVTLMGAGAQARAFASCREAGEWMVAAGYSKTFNAARVGLSTALTGKREHYRRFIVSADMIQR